MSKCKKCGSDYEFYVKRIASYSQFFSFDDAEPTGATAPNTIQGGQIAYCGECDNRLGKMDYDAMEIIPDSRGGQNE